MLTAHVQQKYAIMSAMADELAKILNLWKEGDLIMDEARRCLGLVFAPVCSAVLLALRGFVRSGAAVCVSLLRFTSLLPLQPLTHFAHSHRFTQVDLLLHPLRSELNFPIGQKFPLDLRSVYCLPSFWPAAVPCAARLHALCRWLRLALPNWWTVAACLFACSLAGLRSPAHCCRG